MEELYFTLLGEVRIERDGHPTGGNSPQQQALLCALLLRSGRGAAAHELIGAIWGDDAPDSALANLRTYAWRLRQTLEVDRATPRILVSMRDGYRLDAAPGQVDVHIAEELAVRASAARSEGRYEDCRVLLAEAAGLWRGQPLAGVPGPFAAQQRDRLAELRLALLEERFECDLKCGEDTTLVPDLRVFTREHPLRERSYGFLMQALYRTGRQADALDVFGRARQVLAEELGVDPGPELQALQRVILAGDPDGALRTPAASVRAAVPAAVPAARAAAGVAAVPDVPKWLPPDTADFTGRSDELGRMCAALAEPDRDTPPVLCVTGMGGVGKTALALRAAHRTKDLYPDGQLHADLRGSEREPADSGAVLGTLLTALGVSAEMLPMDTDGRAGLFRTVLDGRRVLIFLDDARDHEQLRPLLPGSAECAVVVTSRSQPAGLPTTLRIALDTLDDAEAGALLCQIVGPERVKAEPDACADLVAACGHLPLALRIAASRLAARPSWKVATMAGRLADEHRRIGELRSGSLAVAAAFSLSHQQLSPAEARAFRVLAPLARYGLGLDAAATALGLDRWGAEDTLESLVDAALLESPSPGRYRYHALVRSFALDLPGAELVPPALAALLDHYLSCGRAAFALMVPGDSADGILRPAMGPAPGFAGLGAARQWVAAESEAIAHTVRLAVGGEAADDGLLSTAIDLLVSISPFGKDVPYGVLAAAAREVAEAGERCGDDRTAGRAHFVQGNAALQDVRLADAARHTAAAAAASQRAGDRVILFQTLNDSGLTAQFQHRYQDAVACYDQALALARELGQGSGELTIVLNGALARIHDGRAAEALAECDWALAKLRGVDDPASTVYALSLRGLALHRLGRYESALDSFQACLEVCATVPMPRQEAKARARIADVLRTSGCPGEALEQVERALALCADPSGNRDRGLALMTMAEVLADLGDEADARGRAGEARTVFERLGLPDAAAAGALAARLGG
ncbi:BTAD domain-containing putative transcriptional regulator [Streptomyces sp. NPDC058401]|uniref:AfsR/SARP family transcriptional regulator n=1 Tax=Streptomyces sp. NPDC058401 TaxID=3346480 RepID=UPI00365E4CF0